MKTEETEKLKSELRDLKEIIELGKKVEEHNVEDTSHDREDDDMHTYLFKLTIKNASFSSPKI